MCSLSIKFSIYGIHYYLDRPAFHCASVCLYWNNSEIIYCLMDLMNVFLCFLICQVWFIYLYFTFCSILWIWAAIITLVITKILPVKVIFDSYNFPIKQNMAIKLLYHTAFGDIYQWVYIMIDPIFIFKISLSLIFSYLAVFFKWQYFYIKAWIRHSLIINKS